MRHHAFLTIALPMSFCAVALPITTDSNVEPPERIVAAEQHRAADMSNDELISRLPPARQEHAWNIKTDEWEEDPIAAEWGRRVAAGMVKADELGRAIHQCGILRSSPTLYEGQPYHVWLRMPSWLPGQEATATPDLNGGTAARADEVDLDRGGCGNAMAAQEAQESFQKIGQLPKRTTEVAFMLKITPSMIWKGANIKWSGKVVLPVHLIPMADPSPVDNPELTALVRAVASVSCTNGFFQDGPSIWLTGRPHRPLAGPLASTLMCLQADLIKDGNVVATQSVGDPDESYGELGWDSPQFVHGEIARSVILRQGIEHYSVRVRGVAPSKPSQWCRPKYWSGEYTVPLSEVLEPECGMRPAGKCGPEGT